MGEALEGTSARAEPMGEHAPASSPTRGFLFCDLRGYTPYLEKHGATAAADLLARYYAIVREAVARYHGAEIKTEGDSFYVVFSAVSAAVQCGLAITDAARAANADGGDRDAIRVGVGIHAGETVDTPEGYVGSAINIAQRICGVAPAGQVLVSDTVRSLTQTVLPITFVPFGRRRLKGVAEPLMLFSPRPVAAVPARPRRPSAIAAAAAVLVVATLAGGAVWWASRSGAALPSPAATSSALPSSTLPSGVPPSGTLRVGVLMPQTGNLAPFGVPIRNAVRLAVEDANAAGLPGGIRLEAREFDDVSVPENTAPAVSAVSDMVRDDRTIAMIGPWGSSVSYATIPDTNRAGLLQCAPSATGPELTKPAFGADKLRSGRPDDINFLRIPPTDDVQGPALASFAYHDLGATSALVVADTAGGPFIADAFDTAYKALGGKTVRRSLAAPADAADVLFPLADPSDRPEVVFFGGEVTTGAPELRAAMVAAGHGDVPFLTWDAVMYGTVALEPQSGAVPGSFIERAGAAAAAGSYASHAALAPPKASFADRYVAAFGTRPQEYAAGGYACVEIIVEALRATLAGSTDLATLRDAVRAYAVDPSHRHETVLGSLTFDANGDQVQQYVFFYRVEPGALGGKGDWVLVKQQDFGSS